ncbi:MAG: hypothetical protein KDA86_02040 [Planctomycetaceae bacterium]|nr:hypothetical protein [Planctomycetaceae bacterium]
MSVKLRHKRSPSAVAEKIVPKSRRRDVLVLVDSPLADNRAATCSAIWTGDINA